MRGMGAVLAIGLVASTAPVAAQEIMTLADLLPRAFDKAALE